MMSAVVEYAEVDEIAVRSHGIYSIYTLKTAFQYSRNKHVEKYKLKKNEVETVLNTKNVAP